MESRGKIPYSREAEIYLLGSIFLEERVTSEVVTRLIPEDFYDPANKNIVTAIFNLYREQKAIDVLTVMEELKRLNLFEVVGGEDYILEVANSVPTVANVEAFIEVIKEKAIERELFQTLKEVSNEVLQGNTNFKDLLEVTERKIINVLNKRQTSEFLKIDLATTKVLDIIEANKGRQLEGLTGLDTGFKKLNEMTFGFQKGELIILAARPAVGKSAFALNLASNACELAGASVAFFSLEMGVDQLVMRVLSSHSGLGLSKIRSGNLSAQELAILFSAKQKVDKFNLYLDESSTTELGEIAAQCRKLKRNNKLDLIIIDYLQLVNLRGHRGNRTEEVGQISRGLKVLARELDVPVVALSQLSRQAEEREKPILADLRESGSIEQDADIVMFLHRANKTAGDETKKIRSARTELIIAKNRQGVTDSIELIFKGANSQFSEADEKIE